MSRILNPNPKKTWTVGDRAFYIPTYSEIVSSGFIRNIITPKNADNAYATVTSIGIGGTMDIPLNRLFETHEAAVAALKTADNAKKAEYKAEIKTVEDLVRFGFSHTVAVCEEYTDWNAREAYRERSWELLGLDPCIHA